MYGIIYNTLRNLVMKNHGELAWKEICEEAGVPELIDGVLDRTRYDDSILFSVGNVAQKLRGVALDEIVEDLGAYFFQTLKKSGHSSILRTLSHNLYGFLVNLDALHDHLSETYDQIQHPFFSCEKKRNSLILHYCSKRKGLSSFVIGFVKSVAREFYDLVIDVHVQDYYEMSDKELCHHYVLGIEVVVKDENYLERLKGESAPSEIDMLQPIDSESELIIDMPTPLPPSVGFFDPQPPPAPGCPFSRKSRSTGQLITVEPDGPVEPIDLSSFEDGEEKEANISMMPDVAQQVPHHPLHHFSSNTSIGGRILPPSFLPSLPSRLSARRGSLFIGGEGWPVTPNFFQNCFPFHIIFDKDLVIRFMGVSLRRLFPKAIDGKLTEYFRLSRPVMKLTYENIRSSIDHLFIVSTKRPAATAQTNAKQIQFRGQMLPTSSLRDAPILFLSSPRIDSLRELELQGLYLADIPIHDVTRDLILLNRHFQVEMKIARELEETKRDLEVQKAQVQAQKDRADQLLHAMLPPSVAQELQSGANASATEYSCVTILFGDIKGFTHVCNRCPPMAVVGMLNQLYTRFDNLVEKHNVYKVETIGDAYMVAAGLHCTSNEHAEAVTNMAFDMREEAGNVTKPTTDEPLQVRIGIHSGPVVAGVVGTKMPRYCLFGDTVNVASRMESHGEPGFVHVSEATYRFIMGKPYQFYSRGKIVVKGLGERQTYFVEPGDDSDDEYDGATRMRVFENESSQESDSEIEPGQERFLRSPSFVKYNHIKPVKPGTSPSAFRPSTSKVFSSFSLLNEPADSLIKMVKPTRREGTVCEPSPPLVRPSNLVPESPKNRGKGPRTLVIIPAEDAGLTMQAAPSQPDKRTHNKKKHKGKCKIS